MKFIRNPASHSTIRQPEVPMGHDKTGHNQMLNRRRLKQSGKKRLIKAAKRAEKLSEQNAKSSPALRDRVV
jgi:predicted transcriptional regulator